MGFLCVKDYNYVKTSYNVYCKLRSLVNCINNRNYIIEFDRNAGKILTTLDNLINDNNKHLFNDLFIVYTFMEGIDLINNEDNNLWEIILNIMENVCSNDVYENIFYYSATIIFYSNYNITWLMPNDSYFKTNREENWHVIFEKLLEDDPHNRRLLNKFTSYCDNLEDGICKGNKPMFESLSMVLCIIASYCIVTNNYNCFDLMVNKLFENYENINTKIDLNDIKQAVNTNRHEGEHPNIGKHIEFILELVKPNNIQKVIH